MTKPPGYWQRREAASQRALARVMRENRVRDECLAIAIAVLGRYTGDTVTYREARSALDKIETRLAELEPEAGEEAG